MSQRDSEKRKIWVPVVLLMPEGETVGKLIGGINNDNIKEYKSLNEFGDYPEWLPYKLRRESSDVLLGVFMAIAAFEPIVMSKDGDMGAAMMRLSNFAWETYIRSIDPAGQIAGPIATASFKGHDLPVFSADLEYQPGGHWDHYVVFPMTYTDRSDDHWCSTRNFLRQLLEHRDYADAALDTSIAGRGKTAKKKIKNG